MSLGISLRLCSFLIFKHIQNLLFQKGKLYYYRSISGKEVDFIIKWGRKILAFEIKHTENPTMKDIKNLLDFIKESPNSVRGVLIYNGDSIKYLHSKVIAIP